jgi:hypothetical protein
LEVNTGFSHLKPKFNLTVVQMLSVVDEVALGQDFLLAVSFSPATKFHPWSTPVPSGGGTIGSFGAHIPREPVPPNFSNINEITDGNLV